LRETSEEQICVLDSEGYTCTVTQYFPSLRVEFTGDGDIDADGAYEAYHPENDPGLDYLANAGSPGNWWGITCDENGNPHIQCESDPAPGFHVSPTAYCWSQYAENNPLRYVDAARVPFIVVQSDVRNKTTGIVMGCRARVTNLENGRTVECGVFDIGPKDKLGEISIAAAFVLGINGDPKSGGIDEPILKYELWPDQPARIQGVEYNLIPA